MQLARYFRLRSLKSRLAVWVILPSVLVVGLDLLVSLHNSEQIARLVQQQLLHGAATMISEQLTVNEGAYEISVPPAAFELLKNQFRDRVAYAIHAPDGRLIAGDASLAPYTGEFGPEGEDFFISTLRDEAVRVIAYSYVIPSSAQGDMVITQVAQTLRNYEQFRDDLLYSTLRRHLHLLAVIYFFLFVAYRWMIKPLFQFSAALEARQPGSLEKFDEDAAPKELATVIHALNDYVQRLNHTLQSYEKFVADTAHHLRNSFAVIDSQVNFVRRAAITGNAPPQDVLGAIQATLARCTRVINQLLMLAVLDQKQKTAVPAGAVPLAGIVTEVIEELAPLGLQKDIELGVDQLDPDVCVNAPPRLLREVLTNVVGNAIQHMKRAGHILVSVEATGQVARLTVTDNGVGIDESLRERVFERFYRVDESSAGGSGLGMAIVKEICDSLGAEVTLISPPDGAGLQVLIQFPLAKPVSTALSSRV